MSSIFGTYGGVGGLCVKLCVICGFGAYSREIQHKYKLLSNFYEDRPTGSGLAGHLTRVGVLGRTVRRLGL